MNDIDTVRPMDRHSTSTGDKTNDLISRHRIAASGKAHCHIVDSLDHDTTLGSGDMHLVLCCFRNLFQNTFVSQFFSVILTVFFRKTVDDLTFLQSAMSKCCKDRIPVLKAVLFLHDLHIFRFHQSREYKSFCLTVCGEHFLTTYNIFFFEFFLKPLVDLVFRLGTLDDTQPVTARSFGVLRSQDLDSVPVLDLIIDIDQLAIDSGTYHLVADRSMDRIGKVNRRRTVRQVLDISVRCKAVYILCK